MGLYDVIGEITQAQSTKTPMGDNRIYGVVVGIVTKNYDESMMGRVCVKIPSRGAKAGSDEEEDNILKWARVCMNSFGAEWGSYFLPEVGDEVLVVFENGNIEKPFVIGCIPKDKNKLLQKVANENNTKKTITTLHGSEITFTDSDADDGKEGQKDIITIKTASKDEHHIIELNNDKKTIKISDKSGETSIVMKTASDVGSIKITAPKKLTLEVGDCHMYMNEGNFTLEAKKISMTTTDGNFAIDSAKNVSVDAGAMTKITGSTISNEAQSLIKNKASTIINQ